MKSSELFDLEGITFKNFIEKYPNLYDVLPNIHDYILEIGNTLNDDYYKLKDNVWIHKSVQMGEGVEIIGPAIVMENAKLRHNAYLRENVIVGKNSVIGNSCEIKNSILIDSCEVPHFNYVGDSIMGRHAHLGAGVIISNLRLDKANIRINKIDTGLRKIGAFIGDNVQIGCNSVICPGSIIYPNIVVLPLTLYKNNNVEVKRI